jgi:hypothetical protein
MSKEKVKPLLKEMKDIVSKERKSGKQDTTPYVIVLKKDGFHLEVEGATKPLLNRLETCNFLDDVREARQINNITYFTAAFPGNFLSYLARRGLLGDGELKALCVNLHKKLGELDELLKSIVSFDISPVGSDLKDYQIKYARKLTNYYKCDFNTTTYAFEPLFKKFFVKMYKKTGLDNLLYEFENTSKIDHEISDLLKHHKEGVNYLFNYCKEQGKSIDLADSEVAKYLLRSLEYLSGELYFVKFAIEDAAKARAKYMSELQNY